MGIARGGHSGSLSGLGPACVNSRYRTLRSVLAALIVSLLAFGALTGAQPGSAATVTAPANGTFDTDLSGWDEQRTWPGICPLCSFSTQHVAGVGNPPGAVRVRLVTAVDLGLLGSANATLTSDPFAVPSAGDLVSAQLGVDRFADIAGLLALGTKVAWRVRLVPEAGGDPITLASGDIPIQDAGWGAHQFEVPDGALVQGGLYRIEIRTTFADVVALAASGDVHYDNVALEMQLDQSPRIGPVTVADREDDRVLIGASVNPTGHATDVRLEWGESDAYGQVGEPVAIGSGTDAVPVELWMDGLDQGRTYHYRVVAESAEGTTAGTGGTVMPLSLPGVSDAVATPEAGGFRVAADVLPAGLPTEFRVQWGTDASLGEETDPVAVGAGTGVEAASRLIDGLAPGGTYHWRIVVSNSEGQAESAIAQITLPHPPSVDDGSLHGQAGETTLHIAGWVNPNGQPTVYRVEWGVGDYANQTPDQSAGSGHDPVPVDITLNGLSPGVTYQWRLVVSSADGQGASSPRVATTLAPPVIVGAAGVASTDRISVSADVDPRGRDTSVHIQWGVGGSFGGESAAVAVPAAAGPINARFAIGGLAHDTDYIWRVVATNADGTVTGETVVSRTTAPAGTPAPGGPGVPAGAGECAPLREPSPPSRGRGKVTLSAAQLLTNQRISQAAIRRLNAVQARLDAGLAARDVCGNTLGSRALDPRLSWELAPAPLAPVTRADPVPIRPAPPTRRRAGRVKVSRAQLVVNQRISQAAVRRANALERRVMGGLTGGDFRPGALGQDKLAARLRVTHAPGIGRHAPSATRIAPPRPGAGRGRIRLSAQQLLINQRIDQAAVRRANALIARLESGITGDMIHPGTITTADLAPEARP